MKSVDSPIHKQKVLVTGNKLIKYGHQFTEKYNVVYGGEDKLKLMELVRDVDGIFALARAIIDREVIDAGLKLKVIARHGVGYDRVDAHYAASKGIWVTITPDVVSRPTADMAMCHLLNITRRFSESERWMREGNFEGAWERFTGRNLQGKTLGILGMGGIGKILAKRAHAFDMKIIYHNRNRLSPAEEAACGNATHVTKDQLICESDCISLHIPATKDTHHYISTEEFNKMKTGVFLVNTSRGTIINENALVEALKSGKVAGAGLDVYEKEPMVHPDLFKIPNVSLTPHIGTATQETGKGMEELTLLNIDCVLSGKEPPSPVIECAKMIVRNKLAKL